MEVHEFDTTINDLQMSPDRTYFITAGKDKSAKVGPFSLTSNVY
jgi:translation initiation factor 3 subunit I